MRARTTLALLVLLGCGEGGAPPRAEPVEAPLPTRVVLSAEAEVVFERTLVRDPEPSCAALTEGLRAPVAALLEVSERVEAPPRSGMRAATCLVRGHASEVEPQLLRWVSHRETMGFALLVLAHLDRLEPALADRVRTAALGGELGDVARRRIERTSAPSPGGDAEGSLRGP